MALTKKESAWIKYGWRNLFITIAIYILFGAELSAWVQALDGLNSTASSLIVFGVVGMLVTTVSHIIDNKKV